MKVISGSALIVRRIADLQRRRELLVAQQERVRGSLPEWTIAPLRLVGLSSEEIRGMMSELSENESNSGLDDIERRIEALDRQIEDNENELLRTPGRSLESVQAVLELALARARGQTATDPDDVFYDYGEARVLSFLERAAQDLRSILAEGERQAS